MRIAAGLDCLDRIELRGFMGIEGIFVVTLVAVGVVLFASEKFPVDLVALLLMTLLLVSGVVTPEEGLQGFSNTATVTVAAMFVLSAGLFKTGALNFIGLMLTRAGKRNFWVASVVMMVLVAVLSAFINNTAVVAIFMPLVLQSARATKVSPSKLLMPLSFAGMLGGVCTLIGTSTNILVSSIAERYGIPPFRMFEFASLGVIFFAVGLLYLLLIGIRLIPDRRTSAELTEEYEMQDYLTEIILLPEAKSVGKPLGTAPLVKEIELDVLEIFRGGRRIALPPLSLVLEAQDVLRVRCNVAQIRELQERAGIQLRAEAHLHDQDLESDDTILVEAVVAPRSLLHGKTLRQIRFRSIFDATVLAVRQRGRVLHDTIDTLRLKAGDALLLKLRREQLSRRDFRSMFVVISEVPDTGFRRGKILEAVAIVAGVVALAALDVLPIVVSAVCGCLLMVLTRCLTLEEAYDAVEWKVIFLLAGVLVLGIALEKTGAALVLSDLLLSTLGALGPVAIVSGLYLLTSLLTEAMSNNATAALLAPIAIGVAETLRLNPRPFLMAITFAASASFMTPVGYQTNTMIYGPGQFKFTDFLRVGTPLNLLFWALASLLIPRFWPF